MDILLEGAIDSIKLVPFLFVTYFFMELLEHRMGERTQKMIHSAGAFGPILGGMLGVIPQCGFSAAASSLYAGRVITVGTLLAIYLSTSDEMLPVLVSESVGMGTILKILGVKVLIAIVSGLCIEIFRLRIFKQKEEHLDIHTVCEETQCGCEESILLSSAKHTLKVFFYIFLISVVLNGAVSVIGDRTLKSLFSDVPMVGEIIAALVGLIPNCASSVVITELYLDGVIRAGAMMSGLLVNAGVGVLVLLRLNHNWKQNVGVIGILYGLGVGWGVLIEFLGIVF